MFLLLTIPLLAFDPVAVSSSIDFDTQIMPVLTTAGCNAGACHGAAAGRGGFHLSLYGSRPSDDFAEITLALEGRRIDRRQPENSLLLKKPTEALNHGGGTRLDIDDAGYNLIAHWVAQGAKQINRRKLETFSFSADRTVAAIGDQVKLSAVAKFHDKTSEDVLLWTAITVADSSAISMDGLGVLTPLRSGRHLLMARYLDRVVPLEVIVPLKTLPVVEAAKTSSKVDVLIDEKLHQLGLVRAAAANDATLIRRLSLDLTGRLPSPEQVTEFESDSSGARRQNLVDRLMTSDAFTEFWTHRFAQLLRLNSMQQSPAVVGYYDWLRAAVATDEPLTNLANALIMADGSVTEHPPANFYAVTGDARGHAEFISEAFLGVRLKCANCHDHPLDSWTQDDYHGLAAIFAGVKRGPVIQVTNSGEVIHPATGEPAVAKIPGGRLLSSSDDARRQLADWITSESNPYFAKAAVNRIWRHLMGRGLVDPVDDLRVTNPSTHPELLHWLAKEFAEGGFRPRTIIRSICLSEAYARGNHPSESQQGFNEYYAATISRPLAAEVFLDAVSDVSGLPTKIDSEASRAISVVGLTAKSETLDLLGRCPATDACETSAVEGDDLSVQLHLLNGALLNARLPEKGGRLHQMIQDKQESGKIITEFYLRAYSRRPSAAELQFWITQFDETAGNKKLADLAEDFVWSLLNSREFMTNH